MTRGAAAKAKKNAAVYQLKVSLRGIEPSIWRRIQLSEDTKLPRLHRILQAMFNWEDYHLHDFVVGKRVYSVPDPDDRFYERKILDERAVPIKRLLQRVGDTLDYHYDFGDNWHHDVLLESIHLAEPGTFYPRCIAGARNGPPEDVGGTYGYESYLEALANPDHERHEELLAWRGPFDPEDFSVKSVNAQFRRTFQRRPAQSSPQTKERPVAAPAGGLTGAELRKPMDALLYGNGIAKARKKRVAPGARLPLELTEQERELILNHTFAPDELTTKLRLVPRPGERYEVRYTLNDLDDLAGYIASEANHTKDRRLRKELDRICARISAILEAHTDE